MSLSKVSFNVNGGVQKGPGTDASFITAMRRQQAQLVDATRSQNPKPSFADYPKQRGDDVNPIRPFLSKGISLSFLKTY
jgi:hypothetical protein